MDCLGVALFLREIWRQGRVKDLKERGKTGHLENNPTKMLSSLERMRLGLNSCRWWWTLHEENLFIEISLIPPI